MAVWYIWWTRRRQSHGEQVPPPHKCAVSICAITANAARMNDQCAGPAKKVWLRPTGNNVKINVDAAFRVEDHSGASGVVIRNNQGVFLAASSTFISHVSTPAMAEALAMLHGLLFANSIGYQLVEAESDSLEVIQLCSGQERVWNEATAIYAEIMLCAILGLFCLIIVGEITTRLPIV